MLPARTGVSTCRLLLAAAVVALLGCGGTTDDRPARWSFISAAITEPSCATVNCHSEIAQRAGLDLHDRATGFRDLSTRNFLRPVDATGASALIYLMEGRGALQMPPDSPLPQADIDLIDSWIRNGATND